ENESTDQRESTADAGQADATNAAKPPRRRRAASRPAGPPVAAETSEPGEVRSTNVSDDPIFDAPWSSSGQGEPATREPQGPVADPFAVPAIDVSALRPPAATGDDASDPAGAAGDEPKATSRSRSGRKATTSRSRSKAEPE